MSALPAGGADLQPGAGWLAQRRGGVARHTRSTKNRVVLQVPADPGPHHLSVVHAPGHALGWDAAHLLPGGLAPYFRNRTPFNLAHLDAKLLLDNHFFTL